MMKLFTRGAAILVGAVFVLGAVLKAFDINLFVVQIQYYHVLSSPILIEVVAVCLVAIELGLGIMLLLHGPRWRLIVSSVVALLCVFSALILYGWMAHDLSDCGCFGRIEMSPGVSLVKNAVLLALAILARWDGRVATWARGKVLLSALAAVALAVYAYAHIEEPPPAQEHPYAGLTVSDAYGQTWDLGQGEYFVMLLSVDCDHCQDMVPVVNTLMEHEVVPEIIGLADATPEQIAEFEQFFVPMFPVVRVPVRTFYGLLAENSPPPRFVWIRDGAVLRTWEEELPETDELMDVFETGVADEP